MISDIKTKHDLTRALSGQGLTLLSSAEVVNAKDIRTLSERLKMLVQQKHKKLHVVFLERN